MQRLVPCLILLALVCATRAAPKPSQSSRRILQGAAVAAFAAAESSPALADAVPSDTASTITAEPVPNSIASTSISANAVSNDIASTSIPVDAVPNIASTDIPSDASTQEGAAAVATSVASNAAVATGGSWGGGSSPGSSSSNPRLYTMDVTVGTLAPDCFSKKVLLVNGQFQPTFTFTQGEHVAITVKNNIGPNEWLEVFDGISIHWHGLSLKGYPWMDGTKYVSQCPIPRGSSFTYRFQVAEMPGTYFWHDHSSLNRADGLQGALIVKEAAGVPVLTPADAEATLFLADWWHFNGNGMALRLNRPFDPTKVANDSGAWCWVGLPKSILINGKGNYYDCEDVYKRQIGTPLPYRPPTLPVKNTTASDVMSPSPCVAGQLGGPAEFNFCNTTIGAQTCNLRNERSTITVVSGQTTRIRIVNAATLVYMTVCFEKHNVTVVALDASPVAPKTFYECVDVNTGQRADVLLTANQPFGQYWISVGSQYRKGAPNGYAALRYYRPSTPHVVPAPPAPATIIQPVDINNRKWTTEVMMSFKRNAIFDRTDSASKARAAPYIAPQAHTPSFQMPKATPDQRFVLQSTQPIIEQNGILRWAFDNIAHANQPPCKPVIDDVYENVNWAAKNAVSPNATGPNSQLYFSPFGGNISTWYANINSKFEVVDDSTPNQDIWVNMKKPGAGTHVITVYPGQMVELVVQNNRAGFIGGEYPSSSPLTNNRNGREQHSFHLHGFHFWQVGMGLGEWNPSLVSTYNLVDPIMRDTVTVLFNGTTQDRAGWVAFRFYVDNAGIWPCHCHIDWHAFMGQGIDIIADPVAISKSTVPSNMPKCPYNCMLQFANFNPNNTKLIPGSAGLLPPDNANLP